MILGVVLGAGGALAVLTIEGELLDLLELRCREDRAEFQAGDEIWVDHKSMPWRWLPKGGLESVYAECRRRLARDGETIASRVLWLT